MSLRGALTTKQSLVRSVLQAQGQISPILIQLIKQDIFLFLIFLSYQRLLRPDRSVGARNDNIK